MMLLMETGTREERDLGPWLAAWQGLFCLFLPAFYMASSSVFRIRGRDARSKPPAVAGVPFPEAGRAPGLSYCCRITSEAGADGPLFLFRPRASIVCTSAQQQVAIHRAILPAHPHGLLPPVAEGPNGTDWTRGVRASEPFI